MDKMWYVLALLVFYTSCIFVSHLLGWAGVAVMAMVISYRVIIIYSDRISEEIRSAADGR